MSKNSPEAVLQISPQSEITFKGPFTDVVVSEISLSNTSEHRACFKIKTTAPRQYCVRPNCGIVEPGTTAVVTVMLQPFHYDGKERVKHKFLVQSMPAPDVPVESVDQLWKDPPHDKVCETKLRCVFEVKPVETPQTEPPKETSKKHEKHEKSDSKSALLTIPSPSSSKSKHDVQVKTNEDLIAEHQKLLEENSQLKLESQRLRKVIMTSSTAKNTSFGHFSESNAISLFTAGLVAVGAIVFGLLLGKFFI